jgi:hypothetical protein
VSDRSGCAMRRRRTAGRVGASAAGAVALTWSLAACTPVSPTAGRPLATRSADRASPAAASPGALVRVITAVTNVPFAIAADQTSVWLLTNLGVKAVVSRPDGAVDEFGAATGQPVRRVAVPPFRSGSPGGAITVDGDRVWATDTNFYSNRGWVAGFSASTGALVRVIGARNGRLERS